MSRPAKPTVDGQYAPHRIQYYFKPDFDGHVEWLKVSRAMKRNGAKTLAGLVGQLLNREIERLGITDEQVLEEEKRRPKQKGKKA